MPGIRIAAPGPISRYRDLPPPDRAELAQFGTAFEAGMDPLEVGNKTLAGIIENRAVIFTHPEFTEDFTEIYQPRRGAAQGAYAGSTTAYRAATTRGQPRSERGQNNRAEGPDLGTLLAAPWI